MMKGRIAVGRMPVSGDHVVDVVISPRRLVLLSSATGEQRRFASADAAIEAAAAASVEDIAYTLAIHDVRGVRAEEIAR